MTPEQIAEARARVNAGSRMGAVIPAMIAEYRRRVELHDNLTGACVELRREKGQQARDFNAATADTLDTLATTLTALLDALEAARAEKARLREALKRADLGLDWAAHHLAEKGVISSAVNAAWAGTRDALTHAKETPHE